MSALAARPYQRAVVCGHFLPTYLRPVCRGVTQVKKMLKLARVVRIDSTGLQ